MMYQKTTHGIINLYNDWVYDPNKAFPYECPYCGCRHSTPQVQCDRCGLPVGKPRRRPLQGHM